jgi:cell division transport system permease protein
VIRAVKYAFNEAIVSLWRGRQYAVLATITISIALFILGGVLLVTSNLQQLGVEWGRSAGFSVYLTDEVSESEKAAIDQVLASDPIVVDHEFVSKADALARFKSTFSDLSSAVESVEGNPLPASYEARLETAPGAGEAVARLAASVGKMPGVGDVRYDRQWLDRLLTAIGVIQRIGFTLCAVLVVGAALTVTSVVRLSLEARQGEIEIMQLVGAPQLYVRGPFVMEGLLQGGVGALIALGVLAVTFLAVRAAYLVPLTTSLNVSPIGFLSPLLCGLLLVGGMVVGCLGGLLAAAGRT